MEDWEKKYYQRKMGQMPQQQQAPNNDKEIDIGAMLMNKLQTSRGGFGTMNPMDMMTAPQVPQTPQVKLKPGAKTYAQIKAGGFEAGVALVKEHGLVPQNMVENVFYKRKITAVLIEGNSAIDLSTVANRLDMVQEFCIIDIPLVGSFLVKEDAIIRENSQSKGILKG